MSQPHKKGAKGCSYVLPDTPSTQKGAVCPKKAKQKTPEGAEETSVQNGLNGTVRKVTVCRKTSLTFVQRKNQ